MNKRDTQRLAALFPNGQPRYVRVYEDLGMGEHGGLGAACFIVVFSGNYRSRADNKGLRFKYAHVDSLGYIIPHTANRPIDANAWGFTPQVGRTIITTAGHKVKRIRFEDLPRQAQIAVVAEYIELWGLPHDATFRAFNKPKGEAAPSIQHPTDFAAARPSPGQYQGPRDVSNLVGPAPIRELGEGRYERGYDFNARLVKGSDERPDKPVTIPEGYLAPGRSDFDAQSQFVEIYRANDEHGGGATEGYFDAYAAVGQGEVTRGNVDEGFVRKVVARIVDAVANYETAPEILARVRNLILPGMTIPFAAIRAAVEGQVSKAIQEHTLGVATSVGTLDEVMFRLEAEAQNDFHGVRGQSLPYPAVHVAPWNGAQLEQRANRTMTLICGEEVDLTAPPPPKLFWVPRARYEKFGLPPFSPICLTCADGVAHLKHVGSKSAAEEADERTMQRLLTEAGFVEAQASEEQGLVEGQGKLNTALAQWASSTRDYEGRRNWFKEVAMGQSVALVPRDADEWASAMAQAEMLFEANREALELTYDDLIGVVVIEDRESGRSAALEPSTADAWTVVQEPARKRVLMALCMDKFLMNPDTGDAGQPKGYVVPPEVDDAWHGAGPCADKAIPTDLVTIPSPDDANPGLVWPPAPELVEAILKAPWYGYWRPDWGLTRPMWVFVSRKDIAHALNEGQEVPVGMYTTDELGNPPDEGQTTLIPGNFQKEYDPALGFSYEADF